MSSLIFTQRSDLPERDQGDISVFELVSQYNNVLQALIDKHAPKVTRTIIIRPNTEWYSTAIRDAKQDKRRLERYWRCSGLEIDRQIFLNQCRVVQNLINTTKTSYYQGLILENPNDHKYLANLTRKLLNVSTENPLPSHTSLQELTEKFAYFYDDKLERARSDLRSKQSNPTDMLVPEHETADNNSVCVQNDSSHSSTMIDTSHSEDVISHNSEDSNAKWSTFRLQDEGEMSKVIAGSNTKHCDIDPIPTWLLKKCVDELLPIITRIVNMSLEQGIMPSNLKEALLSPKIKKLILDCEIFNHYRPLYNLTYISKVIEKVVCTQLVDFLIEQDLYDTFQSAYREGHSTETTLLKLNNDLMIAVDSHFAVAMACTDLSSAFDTVDHSNLLLTLKERLGIGGVVLEWLKSYLEGRKYKVNIHGTKSSPHPFKYGVPQGSILGPVLFTIYILPLGDIIRKHDLDYEFYADDGNLYVIFKPKCDSNKRFTRDRLEACIAEMRQWMTDNWLTFNDVKTEFIILSSRFAPKVDYPPFHVGEELITPSVSVRNLGFIFDSGLSYVEQVTNVVKLSYMEIRKLAAIRKNLTQEAAEILTHSFITSRLDYCNSLYFGLPQYLIDKLQHVQNSAARLITRLLKYDHITTTLSNLHWLPVYLRIQFKINLTTYKALNNPKAPKYIKDMLEKHHSNLRSADDPLRLKPKRVNMVNYGQRAYSYAAPLLWNDLPLTIRQSKSVDVFKSSLKTHYFKQHFGE